MSCLLVAGPIPDPASWVMVPSTAEVPPGYMTLAAARVPQRTRSSEVARVEPSRNSATPRRQLEELFGLYQRMENPQRERLLDTARQLMAEGAA